MTYHNTTEQTGPELKEYRCKARTQDLAILGFFTANAGRKYTASEVHSWLTRTYSNWQRVPLTSVRRAMTNLHQSNKINKTEDQRMGPYGRPEYCYISAPVQMRLV